TCEQPSEHQCAPDSRCEFVQYACDAMCRDDGHGGCLPCNAPPSACRTRTPPTCESLDVNACSTDPRCEVVQWACTLECRDDGHGGCLPCNAPPASCRTRQPTSCEQLNAQQCATDSRCELIDWACTAECRDDGNGGCLPCVPPPSVCRTRQPVACAGLDAQACVANPRCELIQAVCTADCRDDGNGGCLPCNAPSVCVERSTQCYGLDVQVCVNTPGCELLSPVCNCLPNSPSCDCAAIAPVCVPSNPPVACYGLTPDVCAQHPECEFVSRDVCDCAGPNCSCPVVEPSCQPRQPTSVCDGLPQNVCSQHPECELASAACVCPPDATGCDCNVQPVCVPRTTSRCEGLDPQVCSATPGCTLVQADCACGPNELCDCNAPVARCVEATPPVLCFGLDAQACSADPRCEFVQRTCGPNEDCAFDGYCAPRSPVDACEGLDAQVCINTPGCGLLEAACVCPPNAMCDCNAPAPRCVSTVVPTPNPCVGLDVAQCSQDPRCEIGSAVCTAECRDDGNGGCLPCPDIAVCQLRDEGPVVGCGGTPPPAP
ncbi:MAG: hypothetical protein ACO1OB_33190, partial [Archangium sp.]